MLLIYATEGRRGQEAEEHVLRLQSPALCNPRDPGLANEVRGLADCAQQP